MTRLEVQNWLKEWLEHNGRNGSVTRIGRYRTKNGPTLHVVVYTKQGRKSLCGWVKPNKAWEKSERKLIRDVVARAIAQGWKDSKTEWMCIYCAQKVAQFADYRKRREDRDFSRIYE